MEAINSVSHSPLTQSDITRLPYNAQTASTKAYPNDTYTPNSNKKSIWKGIVAGVVIAAAAIVGLKYLGKNSFLDISALKDTKFADMKFMEKAKYSFVKIADYIEYPFIKSYNFIKNLFKGKAAQEAAQEIGENV